MSTVSSNNYIIQLDNMYMSDFMFLWVYYGQPCKLTFVKPNTVGLSAVRVTVDNDEARMFLSKAEQKARIVLHEDKWING